MKLTLKYMQGLQFVGFIESRIAKFKLSENSLSSKLAKQEGNLYKYVVFRLCNPIMRIRNTTTCHKLKSLYR